MLLNIEMFSVGEQANAGKEVVSLRYEAAEVKLGWVTAQYATVLDSVQPKRSDFINFSVRMQYLSS